MEKQEQQKQWNPIIASFFFFCMFTACCSCTERVILTMAPLCLEGIEAEETRSDTASSPAMPQTNEDKNKHG